MLDGHPSFCSASRDRRGRATGCPSTRLCASTATARHRRGATPRGGHSRSTTIWLRSTITAHWACCRRAADLAPDLVRQPRSRRQGTSLDIVPVVGRYRSLVIDPPRDYGPCRSLVRCDGAGSARTVREQVRMLAMPLQCEPKHLQRVLAVAAGIGVGVTAPPPPASYQPQ